MRTGFVEQKGKLKDLDRSFDLDFWQKQSHQVRFQVAWDLVLHAWKVN